MMAVFQEKYNQLNMNALKITKMKYFNEIYSVLLALVTILGWKFSSIAGMIVMILFGTIALLLTKDLKYVIPNCIYFIFMFSDGFANDSFPMPIIVFGGIFAIIILFFSFKDGIRLKKMKSLIGLAGLAITSIIPIIWCRVPKGNEVFYFLFFGNLGYLLLYIIMTNGIKDKSMDLLAISMSNLTIILTCECIFKAFELKQIWPTLSIFHHSYYLGWGLCNEAGILFCLSIPFIFYLLGKQERLSGMIFQNSKILISAVGLVLTTSRGSYLFGFVEIGLLYLVLLFVGKKTRLYQNAFLVYTLLILVLIVSMKSYTSKILNEVINLVFNKRFDDNGRLEIWSLGISQWKGNLRNIFFGPGYLCEIEERITAVGIQNVPLVFHSTIIETLVVGGILGMLFLGIHFVERYRNLFQYGKYLFVIIGTGYIIIDIYGLIDNTYHMYYFMLPLMVIMAAIDCEIYYGVEKNVV